MWSKKKNSALLRSSTCFTQYEQQQSMQYFISHVGGDNGQDILNNIKRNTLTEIEVQTATLIEAKNNLGDWVRDLVWKASGIPI